MLDLSRSFICFPPGDQRTIANLFAADIDTTLQFDRLDVFAFFKFQLSGWKMNQSIGVGQRA